jgi:hypothetical protein
MKSRYCIATGITLSIMTVHPACCTKLATNVSDEENNRSCITAVSRAPFLPRPAEETQPLSPVLANAQSHGPCTTCVTLVRLEGPVSLTNR